MWPGLSLDFVSAIGRASSELRGISVELLVHVLQSRFSRPTGDKGSCQQNDQSFLVVPPMKLRHLLLLSTPHLLQSLHQTLYPQSYLFLGDGKRQPEPP